MTLSQCKPGDRVHLRKAGKLPLYEVQATSPFMQRMGYASLVQVGESTHRLNWPGQQVDVDRLTPCHKEVK